MPFPPGTSKWNKIEHRMFCHITQNWRGRPLVSREVVVNFIGQTTTKQGLSIRSELDTNTYPRPEGDSRADGGPVHQEGQVPRRVELHHFAEALNWIGCCGERLYPAVISMCPWVWDVPWTA